VSADDAATLALLRKLWLIIGETSATSLDGLDEDTAARRALALLAKAGATKWAVPQQWGGAATNGLAPANEVSCRALCALRAALAYHAGILDVMLVMQGLGSYAIARAGADELRANTLPRVANGELVAAFALTEPNAGSDLGLVATRAERAGQTWRITGRKTFISNCGIASFYTVLARTSGEPGDGGKNSLTMFCIPSDARGLSTARFEVTAPHPIGDVVFDGVELADGQRLGEVGGGLEIALAVLGRFRTSVAAAANGFARRALDESIRRLKSREQFGKPLSANQGLRFELAEMDTRLRAAELLVDEAAGAVDRGERATAEVARAKLFATENASWVCDRAVQFHGGLGVKRGEIVERLWRDVRALRIYEGTSEVQKLILAREMLG
jgi:acyl-CoA dehydrogenase